MRTMPWIMTAALFLSACQLTGLTGATGASRTTRTAGTAVKKSPVPSPAAEAVEPADALKTGKVKPADALVRSIHNALGATRATRLSATLNEVSGIISNNGNAIISDNGLGLISDNGLGYRTLATEEYDYTTDTADLTYHFKFKGTSAPAPRNGMMKIYEKAGYKAGGAAREAALLDHFVWDDMGLELGFGGAPLNLAITFPMRKVSSKRLPFAQTMLTRRIVRLETLSVESKRTDIGWQYEFDLDVALLGGATDKASFKSVAGEKDIVLVPTSRGKDQSLPVRLTVTGSNATGTYEGTCDYDKHQATITHTAKDGHKTVLTFKNPPTGTTLVEVESLEAKLKVSAPLTGEGAGKGQLFSTEGGTPQAIGTLTTDAEGVATIAFPDGTEAKARLF